MSVATPDIWVNMTITGVSVCEMTCADRNE